MTRADVLRLALEAGFTWEPINNIADPLERFATLVLEADDGPWRSVETAPKDRFVLLCGPSGYTTTPLVFTTGIMHSNYHAGRWIDHANDDLVDWGFEPTHWMPLPAPPES